MNKLLFFLPVLLFLKIGGTPNVYKSNCTFEYEGLDKEMTLVFTEDDRIIMICPPWDPYVLNLKENDGTMLSSVKYGKLKVDFSNRDSVLGFLIKETLVKDTVMVDQIDGSNPATKIVESVHVDTLRICHFLPVKK